MGRNFTDFLAGAGYFLLDTTREAVLRHDDETAQQDYTLDITDQRLHHEIYLRDAGKTAPEKLKTVIRHPIKKA